MAHTSWCGHCKKMKPDYMLAADDLREQQSTARLAAIDGDRFKEWLKPFGVTGTVQNSRRMN
jgi:thiol-disulfide isomerase/thioredoxin